jgi:ABC-type transporter Mla subunit MlaD
MENDEDKIIANKVRRLRQGINELINTERKKVKGDKDVKLQSLMAKVKDITENKDKYIQQAKLDFSEKIEEEESKLNELIDKANFVAEAKPSLERLQKVAAKLAPEIAVSKDVKRQISKVLLTGIRTVNDLKELLKQFDEIEDKFKTGLKDYIESETIELSSGFGSISMDKTSEISSLAIRFFGRVKELEQKLNIVDGMLE